MLDELDRLIIFIDKEYNKLDKNWKQSEFFIPINQKRKLVKDISEDNKIYETIINYRRFINDKHLKIKMSLDKLNLTSTINSRVKALNSIEFKLKNYMTEKHNYGKSPINKCFNDLYGIRIIFKENITFDDVNNYVRKRFNRKLKCINAIKGEYVATHIYFKKDNKSFQWELQIWDKNHEETNLKSHEKYKQAYTRWEKENKGGESG